MIKWIISDIDGCISPEESVPWDMELFGRLTALSRRASAGVGDVPPMTLCTGRPQPYVEVLAKLLDIRAPIICENGAVLYTLHDNRSRFGPGITPEKVQGLRAVRAFIDREILRDFPDVIYQFGKEAHMSVYSERPEVFAAIAPRIKAFTEQNGGPDLTIAPTHFYLNLSLAGVDKGRTLQLLMAELGVSREEVAGIGDTEGDLPLRDAVGYFACPANARDAVKKAADYVSPYPTLAGMLDILAQPVLKRAAM